MINAWELLPSSVTQQRHSLPTIHSCKTFYFCTWLGTINLFLNSSSIQCDTLVYLPLPDSQLNLYLTLLSNPSNYPFPIFISIYSSTGWHLISASKLTYFADGLVEGQDFFDSCREIREGGRRDVMKANLSYCVFQTVFNENEILQFI